jgi:hypothetical protein
MLGRFGGLMTRCNALPVRLGMHDRVIGKVVSPLVT